MNITSKGEWPANVLSNFAATPFIFDGVECNSAEGFIQALKFQDPDMQKQICALTGARAKKAGKAAGRVHLERKIWWLGREYEFRSPEHFGLIERSLRAKFSQNGEARIALLATGGATLTHQAGRSNPARTSLPAEVFIDILNRIREEIQVEVGSL